MIASSFQLPYVLYQDHRPSVDMSSVEDIVKRSQDDNAAVHDNAPVHRFRREHCLLEWEEGEDVADEQKA